MIEWIFPDESNMWWHVFARKDLNARELGCHDRFERLMEGSGSRAKRCEARERTGQSEPVLYLRM